MRIEKANDIAAQRRHVLTPLIMSATIPLLLFAAWVVFLQAEYTRTESTKDVRDTLSRIAGSLSMAIQKEVEVGQALASSPALDTPDLEQFFEAAHRVTKNRPLWEVAVIADMSGRQLMNVMSERQVDLGLVSDRTSFDQAVQNRVPYIGGARFLDTAFKDPLISMAIPVIRKGEVAFVLMVGLAPSEIQRILSNAGAPDDWIGAVIDEDAHVVAETVQNSVVGVSAQETVKSGALGVEGGRYSARALGGDELDILFRRLATPGNWSVHFGIPSVTLNGPVWKSTGVLVASCGLCLLLAGVLVRTTSSDIDQRRREHAKYADLLIASSEQRASMAIEASELGTWYLLPATGRLVCSDRMRRMLRLDEFADASPGALTIAEALAHVSGDDRARAESAFQEASVSDSLVSVEFRVNEADGTSRWLRLVGRSLPEIDASHPASNNVVQGVLLDVHLMRTAQNERVALLSRLAEAQEDEQRRISRELHDQVGQTLTALLLGLKSIEQNDALTAELAEKIVWLVTLTGSVSEDIHRVACDLRPTALDDVGLREALSALATELSARSAVDFHVQLVGLSARLPQHLETCVYRIVQEAFTNVLKHASASAADAIVERRDSELSIIIADDGLGFAEHALSEERRANRLGLTHIRERLATVGGKLRIDSAQAGGACLMIDIPLRAPDYEA